MPENAARNSMDALFNPKSLAVVGASQEPAKIGGLLMTNLVNAGYRGSLYPVNPKGGRIMGREALASPAQLPQGVDLAILAVPQKAVLPAMKDLLARGVKYVVALTAGFKEAGEEGRQREAELRRLLAGGVTRLVGPNCAGLACSQSSLHCSMEINPALAGKVSLVSQSGSLCSAFTSNLAARGLGVSKYISVGNKLDLGVAEIVEYLGQDPDTRCIALYLEDLPDGAAFLEAARRVSLAKPIVALKAGATDAGARATLSHTGALAGQDAVAEGAFRQAGVVRAGRLDQLYDLAAAMSLIDHLSGPGLGILSDAGGPGVLATDAAENNGLALPSPSPEAQKSLAKILPPFAALNNPLDMTFTRDIGLYRDCMGILGRDGMDGFVVTIPSHFSVKEELARVLASCPGEIGKPCLVAWLSADEVEEQRRGLWQSGVPCFLTPESAVFVAGKMAWRGAWLAARDPRRACNE